MRTGDGALTLESMTIPEPERPVEPVGPQYQVHEEIDDSQTRRLRNVRSVTSIVTSICSFCAIVLAAHIILVLAEANMNNGFASIVSNIARGVSLGLRNLFTPDNAKFRVFLNDGAALLLWLAIGAGINFLIRRFALPGPRRSVRYRRTVE
jgi:hypothetical protein